MLKTIKSWSQDVYVVPGRVVYYFEFIVLGLILADCCILYCYSYPPL